MFLLARGGGLRRRGNFRTAGRARTAVTGARPGGLTEPLEQRTMLSAQWPGVVVGVTPGSTAAGVVPALHLVDHDSGAVMVRDLTPVYPIQHINNSPVARPLAIAAVGAPAPAATGLDIVLKKGQILSGNPEASAAFDQAAAFFEAMFHDPITVVIDAEIKPMGGFVLGEAQSVRLGDTFDTIRDYVVNDANPADEAFVSRLPNESGFYSTLPDGSFSVTGASANRATLLALGVPAAELNTDQFSQFDPSVRRDASITFNSNFPFDYNRTDGISFGKSDFIGVATHEIGHALGFMSAVDEVDYWMSQGTGTGIAPTPLDLFRFAPGDGVADFAGSYRVLSPGDVVANQVFYDGGVYDPSWITSISGLSLGEVPFSTGSGFGDDWQASHWKDDQFLGGRTIGMMDPVAAPGLMEWTAADTRAMSLIGWDTTPAAPVTSLAGTVYEDRGGNGAMDGDDAGLAGWTVYQDGNGNGSPDAGEPTALTGADGAYRFTAVAAGTYTLREVSQAGYRLTSPASGALTVTVGEGELSAGNDFGNQAAAGASISGVVYEDLDADGRRDADENGMSDWTIYQDVNNNGRYDNGTAVRFPLDTPKDILDPGVTTSSIVITDLPGVVTDVNVNLTIAHSFTGDLTATLISPRGTRVTLFNRLWAPFAWEDYDDTTLDDEAGTRIQDDAPPFSGTYKPMQPLSALDGQPMNGTWKLEVRDWEGGDDGQLQDWSLIFENGIIEPTATTDGDGRYEFTGLAPGTYRIRQVPNSAWTQTEPTNNGGYVVNLAEGQQVGGRNFGDMFGRPASAVVGRHVFYNHSALDGNAPAANDRDDAAIATDKQALRAGEGPATSANYTSYSRGINGVMVDIANMPDDNPSTSDFVFMVGNDDDPGNWSRLFVDPEVSLRKGAGANGSDRITLTWPDNAIRNQWLQVTVMPSSTTGIDAADVFYFGNLPGETGDSTTAARVSALDVLAVRRNLFRRSSGVDNRYDFNRDGRISALDLAVVKANLSQSLALFSAPAAAAASAPQPRASFSVVPVAGASGLSTKRVWDEPASALLG